jgi:hypothetical protein
MKGIYEVVTSTMTDAGGCSMQAIPALSVYVCHTKSI